MAAGRIVLVTGPRGSGKSTFCASVIAEARRLNRKVSGIFSHHILQAGVRVRIDCEDLGTGEIRALAHSTELNDCKPASAAITTPRWSFDSAALEWANQRLATAVPADLLVIDELGVLEFEREEGWLNGLKAVDSGQFSLAVLSIRPTLVDAARLRWPGADVVSPSTHFSAYI